MVGLDTDGEWGWGRLAAILELMELGIYSCFLVVFTASF